jgi:hypothetical protein
LLKTKAARLHEANVVLVEQVTEAKRDRDAAAADSSAAVVRPSTVCC